MLAAAPAIPVARAQPVYPYNLAQLGLIEQALFAVYDRYFEPIASATLLSNAIGAADQELSRQNVSLKLRLPPFSGNPIGDWEQFKYAYASAAIGYADQIDQQALAYA